jgi:hypothetical protein
MAANITTTSVRTKAAVILLQQRDLARANFEVRYECEQEEKRQLPGNARGAQGWREQL